MSGYLHPFIPAPRFRIPRRWQSWVYDMGSLTRRLQEASDGDFSVRVVFQGRRPPRPDEAQLLSIPPRQCCLVREVQLLCHGMPWVEARTVIPLSTLSGPERELAHLGTRPLGAYLFTHPAMRRDPPEGGFRRQNGPPLPGRRSVFFLHDKPLLVSEIFLPAMREKLASIRRFR